MEIIKTCIDDILEKEHSKKQWVLKNFKNYKKLIEVFIKANEEEQCQIIKKSGLPRLIKHILNPTVKVQKVSLEINPNVLAFITNPTDEVLYQVITKAPDCIRYLKNPSEEIQLLALKSKKDDNIFCLIKKPSEASKQYAVEEDVENIKYIDFPSETLQDYTIRKGIEHFRFINNPSVKIQAIILEYISEYQTIYYVDHMYNDAPFIKLISLYRTYSPAFLKRCFQLVNGHSKGSAEVITQHPNYIHSDAEFILIEITQ